MLASDAGLYDQLHVRAEERRGSSYPALKADGVFRDLQAQLEGTENCTTVARNRYIKTVPEYNIKVRSFPSNLTAMLFGMATKPSFTVADEAEISRAHTVDFAPGPAPSR